MPTDVRAARPTVTHSGRLDLHFPEEQAMQDVIHPHHTHDRRVWVVPDSTLGRWASFVFAISAGVAIAAPLVAWAAQQLAEPGAGTPWFFAAWGSALVAVVVATGAALIAAVALVHD